MPYKEISLLVKKSMTLLGQVCHRWRGDGQFPDTFLTRLEKNESFEKKHFYNINITKFYISKYIISQINRSNGLN